MTASLQATGGEAVRVINAGHAVNDGHSVSVEVRYDCCAFVLYGGARAVSADDRYSLGHSARHNTLVPGDREADLATEELRLAAFGIAEHGLDGRCRL